MLRPESQGWVRTGNTGIGTAAFPVAGTFVPEGNVSPARLEKIDLVAL